MPACQLLGGGLLVKSRSQQEIRAVFPSSLQMICAVLVSVTYWWVWCMYIYIYIYIYTYMYMYVCVCVCVYIYIYIWIETDVWCVILAGHKTWLWAAQFETFTERNCWAYDTCAGEVCIEGGFTLALFQGWGVVSEVLMEQVDLNFSIRNKFIILLPCGLLVDNNTFSKMCLFKTRH
jgi:hypothetical protein